MIRKFLILPLLVFSSLAFAEDLKVSDKETLPVIFSNPEIKTLSEDEFLTQLKAMDYTLASIQDGNEVEWENKANGMKGKVVILRSKYENDTLCKAFTHVIYLKGKSFEGSGLACLVKGQWYIRK